MELVELLLNSTNIDLFKQSGLACISESCLSKGANYNLEGYSYIRGRADELCNKIVCDSNRLINVNRYWYRITSWR